MGILKDIINKEYAVPTPAELPNTYGYRAALWGDSMTSRMMADLPSSSATYDAKTGVITFTSSSTINVIDGQQAYFYSLSHTPLEVQRLVRISVITTNSVSFAIEAGLDLPYIISGGFIKDPKYIMCASFTTWLNIYSGQAFDFVYNGAASGATAKQCYQNVDTLLTYNPQVVFVQVPGINDWGTPQKFEFEESWGYVAAGMRKILATGARIVAVTSTPVRTGEGRANLSAMAKVAAYRQKLFDFAKEHKNVILFDAYSYVVNPTDTTGLAGDYITTVDNIHYSSKGGQKLGKALWDQIKGVFPAPPSQLPYNVIDSFAGSGVSITSMTRTSGVVVGTSVGHGLMTNEFMKLSGGTSEVINAHTEIIVVDANTLAFASAGTDGAITGTVVASRNRNLYPNSLFTTSGGTVTAPITGAAPLNVLVQPVSGTVSGTSAITARSDGLGNDLVLAITPTNASLVRVYITDASSWMKLITPGKSYYLEAEYTVSGVSGSSLNALRPQIWCTIDSVAYVADTMEAAGVTVPMFVDDFTGVLRTGVLKIPTHKAISGFSASICDIGFSGAGSAVTVKIGRVQLVEID